MKNGINSDFSHVQWDVGLNKNGELYIFKRGKKAPIATIHKRYFSKTEMKENALLIACAPGVYRLLCACVPYLPRSNMKKMVEEYLYNFANFDAK